MILSNALPLGVDLVNRDGAPAPPSRLVVRLKEISDRLDVIWHPIAHIWSVVERWHPSDKRWRLYHQGLVAAPMDVVCALPVGQDPDTVGDYIITQIHQCDLSKHVGRRHMIRRIREMQEHNRQISEQQRRAAMEPILDEMKYQSKFILSKKGAGKLAKKHNVTIQYRR